jgi:hypothetical protein
LVGSEQTRHRANDVNLSYLDRGDLPCIKSIADRRRQARNFFHLAGERERPSSRAQAHAPDEQPGMFRWDGQYGARLLLARRLARIV